MRQLLSLLCVACGFVLMNKHSTPQGDKFPIVALYAMTTCILVVDLYQGMKCLRLLTHKDRAFGSHSRHGPMRFLYIVTDLLSALLSNGSVNKPQQRDCFYAVRDATVATQSRSKQMHFCGNWSTRNNEKCVRSFLCSRPRGYITRHWWEDRPTLSSERAPSPKTKHKLSNSNKHLVMSPGRGSIPRQTDWQTISRNLTQTQTPDSSQ
jgi:hypothetical protein